MAGYLDRISRFAAELQFEDLPAAVVERAKYVLADTLAVAAAGAAEQEIERLIERVVPADGPALLLAAGRRADTLNAALINGTAGTFLELDEGNQFARGHPAVHVVPAIVALGEEGGLSGRELILALVIGYEIGARIGIAAKIRMSMHPHGTWGTVGAAVASAKLAGLDAPGMRQIVNVSSSLGLSTSRQTMLQGGTVRNFYSGASNYLGLMALKLVQAGFTGELDGLGTVYGNVISESFEPEAMTAELGKRFEILRNYFKQHACCRYNHSALDALMKIAAELPGGRIPSEAVERVEVQTYSLAAQLCSQTPANMLAAKFSIPFAVATYLRHGHTGVDAFRSHQVQDESVQALARKVTVTENPSLTALMPDKRPSAVRVYLAGGEVLKSETFVNKGDSEDPYSPAELEAKYFALTETLWGRRTAATLWAELMDLENIPDIRRLTDRLVRDRPGD